jgi:hypothetical protein
LLSIFVGGDPGSTVCLTITGNIARAGSKGVVLEDAQSPTTVSVPPANSVCVNIPSAYPPCWDLLTQCHGDTNNDTTVNITDFFALKDSWTKSDPDPLYNPCADFNRDYSVNISDFFILKDNWTLTVPADCTPGPP